ncbi:inorganic pyrophosphatase [Labilibaculum sp. A4]|uniref:inorganic diphosphatase n=1 Tax=Labilibaculum euxinus TaxID=2686357 RepID=A0A425YBF4_9BACT|nr:inorganic pyrophosphatase [Labilibaculum euxinus]MVB08589.1 inorganic pyrophosphatase [Labilibaculum euxinus]MWN76992.1 inorganic pyrophosphatase [Labilibaculum euxinus]
MKSNKLVIDRKKGTTHPKYENMIYPVDYGFIANTKSMDGGGIDIFIGEEKEKKINGIICIADRIKNDSEIKIIYGCSEKEIEVVLYFLNNSDYMKAIFINHDNNS